MNANFICFVSPILDKCVQQLEQLSSSFQLSMVQQTSATGALAILVILVQMEPELPLESLLGTIIINISCIGTEDLKAGKYTCRSEGACAATTPKNPPPTNAIANWSNCRSGIDSCANGSNGSAFSCCVAPEDVKSGKSTCRAQGHAWLHKRNTKATINYPYHLWNNTNLSISCQELDQALQPEKIGTFFVDEKRRLNFKMRLEFFQQIKKLTISIFRP